MSNKDNAVQLVHLCDQLIQDASSRHLLHTYRLVVRMLRLALLIQGDSLDSADRTAKTLEDRCNSELEIIHALEMYCVQNGLPLPVRVDDYQPAIERPPTKH